MRLQDSGLDRIEREIACANQGLPNTKPIIVVKYQYPPLFLLTFIFGLFISSFLSVSGYQLRQQQAQPIYTTTTYKTYYNPQDNQQKYGTNR